MILEKMHQRLEQSLLRGPSLNCRPHNSRQRIDFNQLAKLGTKPTFEHIDQLLTGKLEITFDALNPHPRITTSEDLWTPEEKATVKAAKEQSIILHKLNNVTSEATDYYNNHGEHALYLALPILSLPPTVGRDHQLNSSRILAPLAFIPIEINVRLGAKPGITIKASGEGADFLIPNPALLSLIEQQTGIETDELFTDDNAEDPWRELKEIIHYITTNTSCHPLDFHSTTALSAVPKTDALPSHPSILSSAIIGLFPINNPGLLRDTRWMIQNEDQLTGPITSFLSPTPQKSAPIFQFPKNTTATVSRKKKKRDFSEEHYISQSDPCQSSTVKLAESSPVLVMHGPPGTGKSQTIVNIIGNQLARGKKVLFVCDKRTAIDVVKYRLDAIDLGHLCGVIHDPQRDRRNFYMGLRKVIENLPDISINSKVESKLNRINQRLNTLHKELSEAYALLHTSDDTGHSYHDYVGQWATFSHQCSSLLNQLSDKAAPWTHTLEDHAEHQTTIDTILNWSRKSKLPNNPWLDHSAHTLASWLSLSSDSVQTACLQVTTAGTKVDHYPHDPNLPILPDSEISGTIANRTKLAKLLNQFTSSTHSIVNQLFSMQSIEQAKLIQDWNDEKHIHHKASQELPNEIIVNLIADWPTNLAINTKITILNEWLSVSKKWTRIFKPSIKKSAIQVLTKLGGLHIRQTSEAIDYLESIKAKNLVSETLQHFPTSPQPSDEELNNTIHSFDLAIQLHVLLSTLPNSDQTIILDHITHNRVDILKQATSASIARLEELQRFKITITQSQLFNTSAISCIINHFFDGKQSPQILDLYTEHLSNLETSLKIKQSLSTLPNSLQAPCRWIADHAIQCDNLEAHSLLNAISLQKQLQSTLLKSPNLATIDDSRISSAFKEYHQRLTEKEQLTRENIKNTWHTKQKERLLSGTQTRLNSIGTSVRQRLMIRGKRALKLRQMVATGSEISGGDPLYDLCPVWMASSDTVAQIFPREAIFDTVIFDEASQCRLEEALPVLLRAKRVVIAGDPMQLPPTRFFESTINLSEYENPDTLDELHDQQISDTEDLLTAAINIEVDQSYLDIHYRSRNQELIEFSNEHFYHNRLQPLPLHPNQVTATSPISLHNVNGIYEEQTNLQEAQAIVQHVKETLDLTNPPTIGIASFNLKQKNLIQDELEKLAQKDKLFATKYLKATQRQGAGSFQGLFVKNLENVQGDERDTILISTTFGPNAEGKFRRHFGVLSTQGGRRRLNVLITRARKNIHIFTSIPVNEYRTVTPSDTTESLNGRRLLYAYLSFAENFHTSKKRSTVLDKEQSASLLAKSISKQLLTQHNTSSTLLWGNEGFCIDLALNQPKSDQVTIGLLTDFNRYKKAEDPIDWEYFRTQIFQTQGWIIHHLWSPRIFRNPEKELESIIQKHKNALSSSEISLNHPHLS